MNDKYLTANDVAEILQISYEKALEFQKYSGAPSFRIGRQYRIAESKLMKFLENSSGKTLRTTAKTEFTSIYNNVKIRKRGM